MTHKLEKFRFVAKDVSLKKRETVYSGYAKVDKFTLSHKKFNGGQTPDISRECFISADAVIVLLYDPKTEQVALIEQFRVAPFMHGESPWIFECVAGRIDKDETAEEVARREAIEEAGCETGRMIEIGGYYPSPGIFAEHLTYFCAEADLSAAGGVHGLDEEDEDIRAIVVDFDDAQAAIYDGRIVSGPTALALQWLVAHREEVKRNWTE